jgi:hypothetical protein
VIQLICWLLLFTLFGWAFAVGRRRQALRNAGVNREGSRGKEWSPEAISAVLLAMDPALVSPRPGDLSCYDGAAEKIFEGLAQCDGGDREALDVLVARSLRVVEGGLAAERETRRAAQRLWEMHAEAHARWIRE